MVHILLDEEESLSQYFQGKHHLENVMLVSIVVIVK